MIKISQKSSHTEDNTIIGKSTFPLTARNLDRRRFYNTELQFRSRQIPSFSGIPHDELLAYISEQARFIYRASCGEFSNVHSCYNINTITKKLEDGDCNGYHAYYNGRVVIWR